jgi:hypothetical protein
MIESGLWAGRANSRRPLVCPVCVRASLQFPPRVCLETASASPRDARGRLHPVPQGQADARPSAVEVVDDGRRSCAGEHRIFSWQPHLVRPLTALVSRLCLIRLPALLADWPPVPLACGGRAAPPPGRAGRPGPRPAPPPPPPPRPHASSAGCRCRASSFGLGQRTGAPPRAQEPRLRAPPAWILAGERALAACSSFVPCFRSLLSGNRRDKRRVDGVSD